MTERKNLRGPPSKGRPRKISVHDIPAPGCKREPFVERLMESGKFDMKHILAEEKPPTDYSTLMASLWVGRMATEDFSTMGKYIANLLRVFEHVRSCAVYILPKKRNVGKTSEGLEHRLTVVRKGDYYYIDESSRREFDDIKPENIGLRNRSFDEKRPVIVDPDVGVKLVFDNLDMNNRNCALEIIGKAEPGADMTAMMPFYYRDPVSPSGIVIFEGDLRCRGTEIDGAWKTFYTANLTMVAAAQISFMLTHKFDAITILTKMADFEADLKQGITRLVERKIRNLYLITIDLDDFKGINDRYGHPAGNKVLRSVAENIKASVRADDLVSRQGGEEFAVILRDVASREEAMTIAERIRRSVEETRVASEDGRTISVTCSIGITPVNDIADNILATRRFDDSADVIDLIYHGAFNSADAGLLIAKNTGKNRVCFNRDNSLGLQ